MIRRAKRVGKIRDSGLPAEAESLRKMTPAREARWEEIAVLAVAILKPQRLQNVVSLVKILLVETANVSGEVWIVRASLHAFQQRRNLVILAAHQRSLAGKNSAIRSS